MPAAIPMERDTSVPMLRTTHGRAAPGLPCEKHYQPQHCVGLNVFARERTGSSGDGKRRFGPTTHACQGPFCQEGRAAVQVGL